MTQGGHPVQWWPAKPQVHDGLVVIGVDGGATDLGTRLRGYDGVLAQRGATDLSNRPHEYDGALAHHGAADLGTRLRGYDGSSSQRDAARAAIRVALREALGELAGLAPDAVMIQSSPGRAPAVSYPDQRGAAPGISITHDEPLSLAAIHLSGAVGIDLQRIQDIPDWRAVALDYLGPDATSLLDAAPPAQRAAAFARAWSAHEARLKCHALAMAEWTPQLATQLAACHCRELAVPPGFAGAVAWRS
jgi:4'-phosphopantetheinyl transferase